MRLEYGVHNLQVTYVSATREGRLRHYLGARYDSRRGVFDWDYHMKLKDMVGFSQTSFYMSLTG